LTEHCRCPSAQSLNQDRNLPDQSLVFVVDDDIGMLKSLQRLLRRYGYDSELFGSAEAFEACDALDRAICVVLDVQLNGKSGIEIRHRLIDAGISLPVIYMTASDSESVKTAALQSGCVAYLTKPFAARSLIEPISRLAAGTA
jgi:FixJ family two-component response regulator